MSERDESAVNGTALERRDFLKVLGVAGAGATLAGCSTQGAEKLIPYVVPVEEITPGMATWYRTTCRECPAGCGMSIRTREGRAVKAEGNPLSPISGGSLCARGQASLHGLYNPDRIPQALVRGEGEAWDRIAWEQAEQRLAEALAEHRGRAVFLTESYTGSMDRLIDDWCAGMGVERVVFDAFAWEQVRAGSRMVYGVDALPVHDFAAAEVVVSFGADFMETWLSPVDYHRGFVRGHAYGNGRKGHFIAVTPHQSLTDLSADEWLPARPGTEHLVALAMARVLTERGRSGGAVAGVLAGVDVAQAAETAGVSVDAIRAAAVAFDNGGRSLAVGPGVGTMHRSGTALGVAVAILNQVAGNVGRTVHVDRRENVARGSYRDLEALFDRIRGGQVGALLVHGPNPLHAVPLAQGTAEAFGQIPFIASFSTYLDETSARAHLLLPDHHFLESWGDTEPRSGVHSIVQPVMMPVFDTKQTGDVLLSVAARAGAAIPNGAPTYYEYLRGRWTRDLMAASGGAGSPDDWWTETLKAGVALTPASVPDAQPGGGQAAAQGLAGVEFGPAQFTGAQDAEFHLVVYPSYKYYDGRLANRPWLQELPDPLSKIAWTSWVEVSPRVARRLGLDRGHVVEVTTPAGSAELPVWIHPAIRDDTIAVQLGQGHQALGRYAKERGVNAARLLSPEVDPVSGGAVWVQAKASLRPTGKWERVPTTVGSSDAHARHVTEVVGIEEARSAEPVSLLGMARAGQPRAGHDEPGQEQGAAQEHAPAGAHGPAHHPLEDRSSQLQEMGGVAPVQGMGAGPQDYPPPGTFYGEYSAEQPRWAMSIDMDRCTGCSACMTACYAENNIAVVGPELVAQGRPLYWIRIESHFDYDEEADHYNHTRFLPMMCQHCGTAPCEPVCPVYASYHTPDGLNGQVYNRCVGTRYCANNCPYKVRYFNYFTYEWPEPLNWQLNPDVTVREKGIMEKCTFCVQRIRDAQQLARVEDRPVMDGEIVPACAQTCPGEAIVFGNIKDPSSRVAQVAASGRGYRVLGELNTQPAVTYLRKVVTGETGGDH